MRRMNENDTEGRQSDGRRSSRMWRRRAAGSALVICISAQMVLGMTACGQKSEAVPQSGAVTPTEQITPTVQPNAGNDGNEIPGKPETAKNDAPEGLRTASSYEELKAIILAKKIISGWNNGASFGARDVMDDLAVAVPEAAGAADAIGGNAFVKGENMEANGQMEAGVDFSDTNVQVEGIAEADIVKTDGKYFYILTTDREGEPVVCIVSVDDGRLEQASVIRLGSSDFDYSGKTEMYVAGDKLVLVRQGYKCSRMDREDDGELYFYWDVWCNRETQTQVLIYDISDRDIPKLLADQRQDGWYVSSREKNGYLYVITEKTNNRYYISDNGKNDADAALPHINGCLIPVDRIYYSDSWEASAYTLVSSIELENPQEQCDSISILAESDQCYMGNEAIYLTAYDWAWNGDTEMSYTNILRITYQDGRLVMAAQGKVKGSVDDQFSLDEKDGYLRVVTTVEHYETEKEADYEWVKYVGRDNSLYILDGSLKVVGALENLAPDEMIYSARYIGDIAYFVTYRNTDPLFSVDVSDPTNPVMLGYLKIPGFSDYLQPYGDHLLLGIGYGAGDGAGEDAINCLKLTMFDISDPANVIEKHTLVLDGFSDSEACRNHRAVLVDAVRGLIGFQADGYEYDEADDYTYWKYTEKKAYLLFGYDENNGFYQRLEKNYEYTWSDKTIYDYDMEDGTVEAVAAEDIAEDTEVEDWYSMSLRGVYVGDYFYIINTVQDITAYQMEENIAESGRLELVR